MLDSSINNSSELSNATSSVDLRLLLDSASTHAIYMLNSNGFVLVWSEGAAAQYGTLAQDAIGRHFSNFYSPEAVAINEHELVLKRALNERFAKEEGWRRKKDGSLFWASCCTTPVFENNQLTGFVQISQDLTEERKTRQAELLASQKEHIYRAMVNGVKDYAIFMLDANGCVMTWTDGARRIKGYDESEIIGKHFSIFYTDDARETGHPRKELEYARKNGSYSEEGWRVKKDGSIFWAGVLITAIYNEHNQEFIGFAKVTKDLTAQKASFEKERKALQKEVVFKSLVKGVQEYAIFMLDPNGVIVTWNEGAQRINGYTSDEVIGKHFSLFYTEEAARSGHPQFELVSAQSNGKYEEEGWRVRKDGTLFWANVVITPIFEEDRLTGFSKVTRDLTEKRALQLQQEAVNNELRSALEAKSRFLSTISHEVRTPMAGVIGLAEILSIQNLGEENNEIVVDLLESSTRLLALLNNLLDSAKMESGKMTLENRKFPLRTVLGDVRQLIYPEALRKKLELIGHCDPSIPEFVFGDELRLRQILLNIAFNAVKFTDKGTIEINCELVMKESAVVLLKFSVRDTGIGIGTQEQEQLFQPFIQGNGSISRRFGGTGLGLSIAKSLVDLMGGKIGIESAHGKGSTFWFEVPFAPHEVEGD